MPDASPSKWHLAHTAWFFETFVPERFERDFRAFDPAFRVLFNSYCQGMAPQHPRAQRGLLSRPALDEVRAWRQQVDERVLALVGSPAAEDAACRSLLQLGLQHEQQHQELLLTDILHALSCNPVLPAYTPAPSTASPAATPLRWLRVGAGIVPLGHEAGLDGEFHFDNEGPRHEVALRDFELASRPVSCGDFQAFIDDGGYRRHELWLSLGWDWVRAGARRAPLYWLDDGPSLFTLHGRMPRAAGATLAQLSYFEADAYARWACARLPTEADWAHAARLYGLRPDNDGPRGAGVLQQMFGTVWPWTQSSYGRLPRLLPGGQRSGRIQRQVHVQPGRAARQLLRHAKRPCARQLPQLLSAAGAMAIQRAAPGARRLS